MKIKYILFLGAVAVFSSCSTAYRSGQTPDDVYYSPAPVQSSYVKNTNDEDQNSYYSGNDQDGNTPSGSQQDQAYSAPVTLDLGSGLGYSPYDYSPFGYNPYSYNGLSFSNSLYGYDPYGFMGMYNPYMYNSFGYGGLGLYNPYMFYNPYNSFYNPYNIYNSPYYGYGHNSSIFFQVPGNINTNTGPRRYNLNAYTNTSIVNNQGGAGIRSTTPANTAPEPTPRTSGIGNVIRRVFTPNRNTYVTPSNNNGRSYNNSNNNDRYYNNSNNSRTFNNNEQTQTQTRTYNNSPSVSTPSSSGSSNSSAPVRSFGR